MLGILYVRLSDTTMMILLTLTPEEGIWNVLCNNKRWDYL